MAIKIGDYEYNTRAQGYVRPELPESYDSRVTINRDSVAITALNTTAILTLSLNFFAPKKLVRIINIIGYCEFVDAGTANYTVNEALKIFPLASSYVNMEPNPNGYSPFYPAFLGQPLNVVLQTNALDQIDFSTSVYGGDIEKLTAITPGASDSLQITVSVVYVPL